MVKMRTMNMLCLVIVLCAVVVTAVQSYPETPSAALEAGVQDAVYLNQRISVLEMRLNSIESSVRTLQQQQTMSQQPSHPPAIRDPEVSLLRSEVELLKGRVRVLECGLVHLDERTLSANTKEARKKTTGQTTDPCRLNPETTLELLRQR
jgi:hypothetical protein